MMMKHTQGPWAVKLKDRKWVIKGPDKKHSPVALVELEGFGMGPSRAVREANARLIAAAPDLLAALEAVLPDLWDGIDLATEQSVNEAWLADALHRLDAARAAVNKAKGGEA